jgi:4-diphosphocytidyl-2-C-methyl-D-erythritol kinase
MGRAAGRHPDGVVTTDPGGRLGPIVRTAPGKLNLTLAVLGRRADGYHALHSIMAELALADRLSVAIAAGQPDSLHVDGGPPGDVDDDLVIRAIRATREAVRQTWPGAPAAPPPLAARLVKRLPVAAGLGGGSSDAAAAIDAALEAWATDLAPHKRLELALSLGSDVPFFLAGGIALVEGRGERVTVLSSVIGDPIGVLLVTPAVHVPTRDVFGAYEDGTRPDDGGAATRAASGHLAEELVRGMSAAALLTRVGILATANDLAPATDRLVPRLRSFRRDLSRLVRRPIGQSGSGPTLWALYPSQVDAAAAADVIRDAVASGSLDPAGEGEPFVAATTLVAGGHDR